MIERYTRPEMGALWTDEHRFQTWLEVELAASEAMAKAGRIPRKDWNLIRRKAAFDVKRIRQIEAEVRHDVIAFLTSVAEHVGPAARHVHKGMTSSDVVDTALSVNLVKAADLLLAGAEKVRAAAAARAEEHAFTPMVGRSHGIHAEPTTFGLKMALMFDEFGRVLKRLEAARETVRVGKLSGAVGTHAHLDPKIEAAVCRKLGLRPAAISTQILQRDRHAEFAAAIALAGTSVERWAQEFRHLQRTEVHEVEEVFGKGQKGSSAMPHKKNPVVAEQLCGLARVLRGYALAAMENVPLWHERDISHSSAERIILPDATILLDYMFAKLAMLVRGMKVDAARMQANLDLTHGLIHSQQVLLLLVEKGVAREEAYRWVQRNAMESWRSGKPLLELAAADPDISQAATRRELAACFDLKRNFRDVKRTFRALGLRIV
ncbi:MAG: adenylosuccinate lyase [Kiritimatiellia bacterium]